MNTQVTLWGVRGSIPNPNDANTFYGSNTTCLEIRPASDLLIIFDAGTGIRSLSNTLPGKGECHIFISHGHSDHVQGLSFFAPFFNPNWTIHLYLPEWLEDLPYRLFDGNSFPVTFVDLKAEIHIHPLRRGSSITLGSGKSETRIDTFPTNHPRGGFAYKLHTGDSVFLFSGDHEITDDATVQQETAAMLEGVELAVVDAAFFTEDYQVGWGHSTWNAWVDAAEKAGVQTLLLSHHMQDRTDKELDSLQNQLSQRTKDKAPTRVAVAREGMRFSLPGAYGLDIKTSDWLEEFLFSLSQYKEETTLLDRILEKAREISLADAGSIYLEDNNELVFAYSQNDTLFPGNAHNKSMYVNMRLPITEESIAGYVAATGKILNLPNVRSIGQDMPFQFNENFDKSTGYTTVSMLTVPIGTGDNRILGVLQLINSLSPVTQKPQPFSDPVVRVVRTLANRVASFLEVSNMMYQGVNQILRIAMLHDPAETGPHAERVGAICAEVYHVWATQKGLPIEEVRAFKGRLRLAAMVHDIGKVGISDLVLKKPGKLDDAEFAIMRTHTNLGAELFANEARDIAEMSHEIALHHHQKWNGKGYPAIDGNTPAGQDIPLSARLTAIADVYDALVSPRCYKEPWTSERAVALLKEEAGQHFDPELVECFTQILDTVTMIYDRYPDHKE